MTWLDISGPMLIGLLLVVYGLAMWLAGYHSGKGGRHDR